MILILATVLGLSIGVYGKVNHWSILKLSIIGFITGMLLGFLLL